MRSSRWTIAALGGLALVVRASPAGAHLVSTGLGPVYDGLIHFALAPEDLAPVLALGLLAGLRGPAHGRRTLFVLPAAWLLGGWLGLAVHARAHPALTAISFIFLGGLVAADAPLSPAWITVVAGLLGLGHGYLNGMALAPPGPGWLGLLGTTLAVFIIIALTASFVLSLRPAWARVAVRVAGSWIAAIGLLLLGWGLRRSA